MISSFRFSMGGLMVASLILRGPIGAHAQNSSQPSDSKPQPEGSPRGVTAKLIVLRAAEAGDEELQGISAALGAIKGVFGVAVFPSDQCVSILASAHSPATVERAIQYLGLAGYTVKEADPEVYARIEAVLKSRSLDIPASIAGSCAAPVSSQSTKPHVPVRTLAESVDPLRDAFNQARGKYRFVALLSPT